MTSFSAPRISIIIPCYNLSGYLEPCLNSCILQTYPNIEILMINDGSQDNTKEIIDYYAKLDSRVVPINKNNEGVAKTRKIGIEKATGDYLFFLDGDDYLPLDAIEILLNEIIEQNADIVVGNFYVEQSQGFITENQIDNQCLSGNEFIKIILKNRIFSLCAKLFKKELFTESLNYHYELKRGEDASLLIQLVNNAAKVKGLDKKVYYYRYRCGSVTKETTGKNFFDAIKSRFIIEDYAIEYGISKERDFELGEFICFALILILINSKQLTKNNAHWKKIIKSKIKIYLYDNQEFTFWYKKNFNKNYWRLKFYLIFSLPDKIFSFVFKVVKIFF
ncbi:MAG: glycosyltransferase [Marinilabiliaceae bacterium]|nr:glycosyltransferase [Marinilabiliaceae bacterium]